jgi:cytochrome oxidase Cu insertion factor (SCO1/SenC/PrrC family)
MRANGYWAMSTRFKVIPPMLAVWLTLGLSIHPVQVLAHDGADPKAHQHSAAKGLKVSMADYVTPQLSLVRDDGKKVSLPNEIDDGRIVVLNFIYTTWPGICSMMSQVFSQFQERLGADRDKVHMVSISIDPEQDTPARLRVFCAHHTIAKSANKKMLSFCCHS